MLYCKAVMICTQKTEECLCGISHTRSTRVDLYETVDKGCLIVSPISSRNGYKERKIL